MFEQNLREHEFVHRDINPFRCGFEGCEERFRQRSKLSNHRKEAHPNYTHRCMKMQAKELCDYDDEEDEDEKFMSDEKK